MSRPPSSLSHTSANRARTAASAALASSDVDSSDSDTNSDTHSLSGLVSPRPYDVDAGGGGSSTARARKGPSSLYSGSECTEDSEFLESKFDASVAQMLYDGSRDAVFILKDDMTIKGVNTTAQHMLGYYRRELVGTNFSSLLPKHFRGKFDEEVRQIIARTRPGDLEEMTEAYGERKSGVQFPCTLRITNNLASLNNMGLIITMSDESAFITLQSSVQRRVDELTSQIDLHESVQLKARTKEEQELATSQALAEAQLLEKRKKKKEAIQEAKALHGRKNELLRIHEKNQQEMLQQAAALKETMKSLKAQGKYKDLHALELKQLDLLFEQEAQNMLLADKIRAEETKFRHMGTAAEKTGKQLKHAHDEKAAQTLETNRLRKVYKAQRALTKTRKTRELALLRETQIEELQRLEKKHMEDLFHAANNFKKESRKLKFEQAKLEANLLESQTKHAAELVTFQESRATDLKKINEQRASTVKLEQEAAAGVLRQNQNEIMAMLSSMQTFENERYSRQDHRRKYLEFFAKNCTDVISLYEIPSGRCLFVSPSCEDLLGYTPQEFKQQSHTTLIASDTEDDLRNMMKQEAAVTKFVEQANQNERCVHEMRLRKKDGCKVWVERVAKLVPAQDLSSTASSPAPSLASSSSASSNAVSSPASSSSSAPSSSPSAPSSSSSSSAPSSPMLTASSSPYRRRASEGVVSPSLSRAPLPLSLSSSLSSSSMISSASSLSSSASLEPSKDRLELLFIYRDISAQRSAGEQRRKAEQLQKNAAASVTAQRDFLAFVGHECRNPLSSLINITDFLADSGLNAKQQQYLDIMKSSCGDMLDVLNTLLDLSKLEAGKFEIEAISFGVRTLVEEVASEANAKGALTKGSNVRSSTNTPVKVHVSSAVPSLLTGDAPRTKQVLGNIVSFAQSRCPHTSGAAIQLHVGLSDQIDSETVSIEFKVKFTGTAQKTEIDLLRKLFNVNEQINVTNYVALQAGSGVGLRLCALIVQQAMGGTIEIRLEGGMTAICITVPFVL